MMIRSWISLAVAVVLSFVGATSPKAENRQVVVIQALQSLLYLPLYVAIDKGLFLKYGLEVKKETANSASVAVEAVASGKAHFSVNAAAWSIIAATKGAPLQLVANCLNGAAIWIVGTQDTDGNNVASWKGHSIVVAKMPATSTALFRKFLRERGLDPDKDVKQIEVTVGTEYAALLTLNGVAKIAVAYEPSAEWAIMAGMKVLVSFPKLYNDFVSSAVTARKDADLETVQAFVNGMQDALNLIATDPDAAVEVAKSEFPLLSPEIVEAAVRRMIDEKLYPPTVEITKETLERGLKVYVAPGQLPTNLDLKPMIGGVFIEKAMAVAPQGTRRRVDFISATSKADVSANYDSRLSPR